MNVPVPISLGFEMSILAGRVGPSSIAMYSRDFKAYLAFAETPEEAIKASTLDRWITHLANSTDMSPNTINRMVSAVKKIIRVAAKQGYVTAEVAESFKRVDGVKVGAMKDRLRVRNRIKIEPDTMRILIDSIDTSTLVGLRNKALFVTLASSGLRIKELTHLKPEQIIERGGGFLLHLYAQEGKNQEEDREANISIDAVEIVREWLARRTVQSAYMFTSFTGSGDSRLSDKPITPQGAWLAVKEIAEPLVPGVKPHDFRRFVGTQLAKHDLREAQIALGHKRIETTAKYDLREIRVGATDNLY